MANDMLIYWLWLISVSGVANMRNHRLIEKYGNPYEVYKADPKDFTAQKLMNAASAELFKNKDLTKARRIHSLCIANNISIITADSPQFPQQFKNISPMPLVLFVKGFLKLDPNQLAIAVVGTRRCSRDGASFARNFAHSLASLDIPIVSGLADGIDAQAHIGALQADGYTIAFLANSVDFCYPSVNKSIYAAICKKGAVVSEYPPFTKPLRSHFHTRNRLISALSTGTVIVETREIGGAIITAGAAAEQGKDVFVVPHGVASPYCKGAVRLIKDGAYPICDYKDVLEYYSARYNIVRKETAVQDAAPPPEPADVPIPFKNILSVLGSYPRDISEIAYDCGITASEAASALTMLEIDGKVVKLAGSNYIINN